MPPLLSPTSPSLNVRKSLRKGVYVLVKLRYFKLILFFLFHHVCNTVLLSVLSVVIMPLCVLYLFFCRGSSGIQIVFNLLFGMSIFTSGFCLMTVTERVSKAKHIQYVSGVYTLNFWLSALLWDLVIHFVACVLLLVSVTRSHCFGVCLSYTIDIFYLFDIY